MQTITNFQKKKGKIGAKISILTVKKTNNQRGRKEERMKNYFYQIKGKNDSGFGNWDWPPVFSGMVQAKSKKEAKLMIEEEYGRKFPLRVLSKDLDKEHYLLNVREISDCDERTKSLFDYIECEQCGGKFRVIDKYNDYDEPNKGSEFCSQKCRSDHAKENTFIYQPNNELTQGIAYIYQIKNKHTGMSYIGKTTQVFTLRWYQHFYQSGDCKFHQAIKESNFTDWTFTLLEFIEPEKGIDKNQKVREREGYWIEKFDAIENGYNSVAA